MNKRKYYTLGNDRSINHTSYYESTKLIDPITEEKVFKHWQKGIKIAKTIHEQKKISKEIFTEIFGKIGK